MGVYVQWGKNNVQRCHFLVGMAFFLVNAEKYRESTIP